MQKSAVLATLLVIVIALSGCEQFARGRNEIDKLFIARIMSIDEAPDGKVKITLTTKDISTGSGGQQQMQLGESIASEGDTVFDAARNLLVYADRKPHYGHIEYILFGEAIARKGIQPYLDFTVRQNDIHFNAKIYIVKGDTANNLVKKANTQKMFVGDRIMNIEDSVKNTSLSSIVTLSEVMQVLDNKNLNIFIPFIELTDTMTSEAKEDKYDILLRGYAVFKSDKLLYFTSRENARGINWINGRIGSALIVVKSKNGEEISLEIVDSKVKVIPRIEDSELHCTVGLSFTTNIGEVMGRENVIKHDIISYLTEQQEKAIKQEVENTIKIAQGNNSDQFGIISKFILNYPMMRDYFEENWKDLFPDIKFDVRVESRIKGTYLISEPTGRSEGATGE